MINGRKFVLVALFFIFIFAAFRKPAASIGLSQDSSSSIPPKGFKPQEQQQLNKIENFENSKIDPSVKDSATSPLSPQVLNYFDQVFSLNRPATYDFPALRQTCEHVKWLKGDVYLQCVGKTTGLVSIISQVKVCLKMALEAGVGIVLPTMPARDPTNPTDVNSFDGDEYMTYDKWFDTEHLIEKVGKACPLMKIIRPDQLDTPSLPVKNQWEIDLESIPDYQPFAGYFWAGRSFKSFFEYYYNLYVQAVSQDPGNDDSKKGITVIKIASQFLLFKITDDPTGQDLKVWNDLAHLLRLTKAPRQIVHQLLSHINRPFYGVHFGFESNTRTLEGQLGSDFYALDRVWEKYGTPGTQKPLVYVACRDQEQAEIFVSTGKEKGWEVTHKWQLAQSITNDLDMINNLELDFQWAIDMGILIKSHFFLGIIGSAFASTVGNARDVTGKYRGSSFTVYDDGNARTHLFNDDDKGYFACCL